MRTIQHFFLGKGIRLSLLVPICKDAINATSLMIYASGTLSSTPKRLPSKVVFGRKTLLARGLRACLHKALTRVAVWQMPSWVILAIAMDFREKQTCYANSTAPLEMGSNLNKYPN